MHHHGATGTEALSCALSDALREQGPETGTFAVRYLEKRTPCL